MKPRIYPIRMMDQYRILSSMMLILSIAKLMRMDKMRLKRFLIILGCLDMRVFPLRSFPKIKSDVAFAILSVADLLYI